MPLSQELIADVLGLSEVHVNRTVQALRRAGLIEVLRGSVTLRQMRKLRAMTEYDDDDWSSEPAPVARPARAAAGYLARA
jgi:DNA-binding Lrp family transcriptional regulator